MKTRQMITSLQRFAQNLVAPAPSENTSAQRPSVTGTQAFVTLGLWLAVLVGLVGARIAFVNYQSGDYNSFLSPWFDTIEAASWRHSLAHSQANYFPPYLYLMVLVSRFPIQKVVALKLICWLGDVGLACAVFSVSRAIGQTLRAALLVTAVVLAVPPVLFDSAMWCQTDAIYCAFLVLALAAGVRGQGWALCALFASALAFKMQALFFAPVLALLLYEGRVRMLHFAAIPLVHFAWMLPSVALGATLGEVYGMFATQANFYHQLQLNAPSLYQLIPQISYEAQSGAGIFAALAIIAMALVHAVGLWPQRASAAVWLTWSSFFVMLVPFVLPKMHDRYFFVANVFSIVCACAVRRPFAAAAALLCNLGSLIAYEPFLFHNQAVPLPVGALAMLIALAQTWWLARSLTLETIALPPTQIVAANL